MDLNQIFGKNLKYYRYLSNLTQEKVAERLNISTSYLSNLENGNYNLPLDKINILCDFLNINPYQLFLTPLDIKLPKRVDNFIHNSSNSTKRVIEMPVELDDNIKKFLENNNISYDYFVIEACNNLLNKEKN